MSIFITVILTLAFVIGLAAFAVWYFWDDIARQQEYVETWRRAWESMQVEYDADQRLRDATRAAMDQMLGEVRKHESGAKGTDNHA